MRNRLRAGALMLALIFTLSACQKSDVQTESTSGLSNTQTESSGGLSNMQTEGSGTDSSQSAGEAATVPVASDMFTDRDYRTEYTESKSVLIQLNGDSAECSSKAVQISGTTVTITDEGTYILTGTLNDGMIIVNADEKDKPQLVLNGVSINSETSAPLYILEADKVFVTLAEGTENTLSNGGSFVAIDENNIDAVVFSKQDLTFNGSGSLTVTSPGGHGIVSKDDLVFTGGVYTITAASHGLDANDSVRIVDTVIEAESGKDGIHAENSDDTSLGFVYIGSGTLKFTAEGDGIDAGSTLQIDGGVIDITAGGGSANGESHSSNSFGCGGMMGGRGGFGGQSSSSSSSSESTVSTKGIKATGDVTVNGGAIIIDSADDAIHSNASVIVNGGEFEIATGDDGIHADETLTITSGTMTITKSYEGLEGLHIAVSGGNITLTATDDGLNAAGGTDSSGFGGFGNDRFGGHGGSSTSNGSIVISGGNLYVKASGDGLDANGTLEISGGMTIVCGPTSGDTATLDYDVSGVITGGTFIGTGSSMMAQTFSDSDQGVFAVSVGNQSAGTQITLVDEKGNTLFDYAPELSFAVVILSSPELVKGQTYTVTVGSASGSFEAN